MSYNNYITQPKHTIYVDSLSQLFSTNPHPLFSNVLKLQME